MRKLIAFFLAVLFVFGSFGSIFAGTVTEHEKPKKTEITEPTREVYSGTCGADLSWTLDTETGVLEITGTGDMTNWTYSSRAPWSSYLLDICSVEVSNGVTSIGNYAFYYGSSLKSVILGDSIKAIGTSAFEYCSSLTSLFIPDSVTQIGNYALRYCESLTIVTIGSGLLSLGKYVFHECSSLKTILVDQANRYFCSVDGILYNKEIDSLLYCPEGRTESCIIPDNVEYIAGYAFQNCRYIPSIAMGNNVRSIGSNAFYNCSSLVSVAISDSIVYIENYTFYGCRSLENIALPENVAYIGNSAFCDCCSLTSFTIPCKVNYIGDYAFGGCSLLESIIVDYGNEDYCSEDGILYNKQVTDLICCPAGKTGTCIIPNSVTSIRDLAFSGCKMLTDITLGDGLLNIGNYAFRDCSSIVSIIIPCNVAGIGNYAFYSCSSLSEAIFLGIPPYSFGDSVFESCASDFCIYYTSGNASEWAPNGETMWNWYHIALFGYVQPTPIPGYYTGSCGDNLIWTLNQWDGTMEIDGTGEMTNWINPEYVPWYPYIEYIKRVDIKAEITYISDFAFDQCNKLIEVNIPTGVTTIGNCAFSGCSSLKTVSIPEGVKEIWGGAFSGCSNLVSVNIPYGVTSIGAGAFSGCTSLISIVIPDSVTYTGNFISGYSTFAGCSALESVIIGNGVKTIGEKTFYNCTSLASVSIGGHVTSIGGRAFEGCNSLAGINVPESVTSIGDRAFKDCSSLTSMVIPDSVTDIDWYYLFNGCLSLQTVSIGNGITTIGEDAFCGCVMLTSVIIPDSITSIGEDAFSYCNSLLSINIPDSVTNIDWPVFKGCSSLEEVRIGNGVPNIGNEAFKDCGLLTTVIIGNSVTSIGFSAFEGCSSLLSISIPDSVTSMGSSVFERCTKLRSVSIGIGITSIEKDTFRECSSLLSVIIPDNITDIGDSAFSGCDLLNSVTIGKGVVNIGDGAFCNCRSLVSLTIGSNVECINSSAFVGCEMLTTISIPSSVNVIQYNAFKNCISLNEAIFYGAPPSYASYSIFDNCAEDFCIYYTSAHASEWAPNGETTWNGYPIALLAGTDEPDATIAPVVTPEPTELTKAPDMFYENCYIADIWLDRYEGEADCESPTVESQYFQNILDQESLCEILYNARVDDPVFNGMLAAWNGSIVFFDPVGHVYKELEIQQTYEAVILDFISRTIEEEQEETDNILAEIVETDTWNELGTGLTLESKYHKLLDLLLKAADLGNGILPPDLLTSLKSCDFAPTSDFWEKYDTIFKKHDYLSSWANDEVFRDIGLIVSVSTDTIDFLKRISAYYYLTDVSKEMQILLQEMYDQSNDDSFRAAINSVLFKINHTKWIDFVTAADYTVTVAGKALTEIAIGAIWKAFASEELMAAKIGYQVGKFLSNTMFNTQATIDKYYLVKATAEFISANKAAISSLAEKYLDSGTEADAGAYLYAMRVYRYAAETDFESGKEFYSACEEEGLVNRLDKFCKFVAMLLGADNQKSNYEMLVDNIESILSSYDLMFKIAEFNWINYLRVDYPQTYAELAPQILSDSDYIASIVCVSINENGETEVLWNLPNAYKDSSNNLHYIGTSLIDGVELTEIVNNETTVQTQQSDGGTCTFYNASSFDYFPKVYKIRSYTDTESGKVYSDYSEFVFDSPLKRVDLLVGKVNGETAIAILDITSGEYDVQYHIYRMNSIGEYDLIDTINRSSNKHLRNFTVYLDSTASNGRNRYKVVSELSFANGQSLFAESKKTFSYQQETETVIDDISIRIVGRNFVRGIDGRNGYFFSDSEDSEITAYGYELTWEPYENAEGYQIYRKEAFGENYNLIAEVDGSETTYLDSTADVLLGYEFMIIPYTIEDGVKTVDTGNYAAGILTHTVTFVDWDGTVLSEQTIEHSHGAEAPEVPGREGYAFIGWDHNVGNIQDDVTITALYGPRYGDIDCSGLISMADVTILSMYLNGENPTVSEPGMLNADANADGTVDIRDIAAIYAIIAAS